MKSYLLLLILVLSSHLVIINAFSQEVEEVTVEDKMENIFHFKLDEAAKLEKKTLHYYEKKYGWNGVELLQPLEALAWIKFQQGDYRGAEVLYRRMLNIRKLNIERSDVNTAEKSKIYFLLGDTFLYREEFRQAEAQYDQSIKISSDPIHIGDVLQKKAVIYGSMKDYNKSADFYLRAIDKYQSARTLKPQDTSLINKKILNSYTAVVNLYRATGQNAKAQEYQEFMNVFKWEVSNPISVE